MLMCLKEYMILLILMQKTVAMRRFMSRDDCNILMGRQHSNMLEVDILLLIFLDQLDNSRLYKRLSLKFSLVQIFAMFLLSKNSMDNILP